MKFWPFRGTNVVDNLDEVHNDSISNVKKKGNGFDSRDASHQIKMAEKAFHNPKTGYGKNYIESVKKTKGNYSKRGRNINSVVNSVYNYASSAIGKIESTDYEKKFTVFHLYVKLVNILRSDKYTKAFRKSFAVTEKAPFSALSMFTIIYTCLVYSTERLSVFIKTVEVKDSHLDDLSRSLEECSRNEKSLYKNVLYNVTPIVISLEALKDPLKEVNRLLKKDRDVRNIRSKMNSRESYDPLIDEEFSHISEEERNLIVSSEAVGAFTGVLIGITILGGLIVSLFAVRRLVYTIGTAKYDLGKYLEEEAEMLSVSIIKLEEKAKNVKSKEDKGRLMRVIKRQRDWMDKFTDWSTKLIKIEDEQSYEIDEIYEEDEDIFDNNTTDNIPSSDEPIIMI